MEALAVTQEPQHAQDDYVRAINALSTGDFAVDVDMGCPLGSAIVHLARSLQQAAKRRLDRVVDFSVTTNEASIGSAQLLYSLQNVDKYTQSVASATEQMNASIREVRRFSEQINEGSDASLETALAVSNKLDSAVAAFDKIHRAVQDNNDKLTKLTSFAKTVSGIADDIRGIAFQTNLLSLNASVEASRAGKAGLGFGVVAQEMRFLSSRSETAAKKIANLVVEFERELSEICASLDESTAVTSSGQGAISEVNHLMDSMIHAFEGVSRNTSNIAHSLTEQANATEDVVQEIATVASNTFSCVKSADTIVDAIESVQAQTNRDIEELSTQDIPDKVIKLAQSDHVIWKKNLVSMIVGKTSLSASELSDHHSCRLGKWYDKVRDDKIRRHPAYSALQNPHKVVHQHGVQAVELYNRGRVSDALEAIARVEAASTEVLRLLKALEGVGVQ